MWEAPESETSQEGADSNPWLLVPEGLLVVFVAAMLFTLAPQVPDDSAEAGFLFAALFALVTIATLRFLARAADFALRE